MAAWGRCPLLLPLPAALHLDSGPCCRVVLRCAALRCPARASDTSPRRVWLDGAGQGKQCKAHGTTRCPQPVVTFPLGLSPE